MPRKPLIYTDASPYHIINRSNNKEFFYLPLDSLWPIFMEVMAEIKELFGCEYHFFVLMDNHYHLIVSTPNLNIGDIALYFHREVARRANKVANRINHFFGGRYKWSVINNENYYWNAVKYLLRNPVKAGIVDVVQDYKFSSYFCDTDKLFEPIDFFGTRRLVELNLDWLNDPFQKVHDEAIAKALRRREFKTPKCPTTLREIVLPTLPSFK